jgi:anti-sigma regulatory factor (Ser/Thr protein kinase)
MLKVVLPPDTTELARLRDAVRRWADQRDIPEWPLTLIVTELAANAMAVTPETGTIEVSVAARSEHVEVAVTDPGPGFVDGVIDLDNVEPPPITQPRGRGLFLVRQFSDQLQAHRHGGRTTVLASQQLRSAGDQA